MRGVIAAVVGAVLACGVTDGQEKKAESKYDTTKELDKKTKAAVEEMKKRGEGYPDKSIAAFGEVITNSDPNIAASQRVAGQAVYYLHKLYSIKEAAAWKEYAETNSDAAARTLTKVRQERELWGKTARTAQQDLPALERSWLVIQRDWTLEDLKKK